MRRIAAVVVTAVALAACGAANESARPGDTIAVAADEVPLDRAAVAAREETWLVARPAAYSYEVETTCECFLSGTYRVTVVGDEVVAVESREPGAERYRVHSPPILDAAFAMLDEPLALAADGEISEGRASAAFDPTYGFPVSWTVTGSDGLPSHHAEVRAFQPLDPATIDRSQPRLTLVISNQSFADPDVRLTVTVDGEIVADSSFAVGNQHTFVEYRIPLDPGDHRLHVRADTGATHERTLTLGSEPRYVYLGYWGGDPDSPDDFSVNESDEPFGFA